WRDPSQPHPVLAGRTRWPLSNRNAHHPVSRANDRRGWEYWSVRFPTFSDKNLAQFLRAGNHSKKSELVPTGHGWMRDRHGLGPEAPLSPKGGVVLVWLHQTCSQPMSDTDSAPGSKPGLIGHAISENGLTPRSGRFCYPCAFICSVAPLSLRV